VDVATIRTSPLFAQAEKAYKTATAILPGISGISLGDRFQIESGLRRMISTETARRQK
jgi:hypothetical protein